MRSDEVVWWQCEKVKEHIWKTAVKVRTMGSGCSDCAKIARPISKRANAVKQQGSLLDNFPELVKQWHPTKNVLTPSNVTCGSSEMYGGNVKRGLNMNGQQ